MSFLPVQQYPLAGWGARAEGKCYLIRVFMYNFYRKFILLYHICVCCNPLPRKGTKAARNSKRTRVLRTQVPAVGLPCEDGPSVVHKQRQHPEGGLFGTASYIACRQEVWCWVLDAAVYMHRSSVAVWFSTTYWYVSIAHRVDFVCVQEASYTTHRRTRSTGDTGGSTRLCTIPKQHSCARGQRRRLVDRPMTDRPRFAHNTQQTSA